MSAEIIAIHVVLESTCAFMCLLCFLLTFLGKNTLSKSGVLIAQMLITNVFLLVADSVAYAFRGNVSPTGFLATHVSNYLVFVLQFVMLLFSIQYIIALLEERKVSVTGSFLQLLQAICLVGIALVSVSQFNGFLYDFDAQNNYFRKEGIYISMFLAMAGIFVIFLLLIFYFRRFSPHQRAALMLYVLFPLFSVALQTVFYGISFMNICMTLTIIASFMVHEAERIRLMEEQALQLARQQEQLTEQRIQLITSQIHPHFLYNALATISSLCQSEPATAEMAVNRFAEYLRMNLDALSNASLIPFSKELEHSKTYLWLEHLRFGDILNVEYDIQYTDFLIPPLVMQPIVENAVKHGIFLREDGGTVCISTRRTEKGVEICVRDDGVGFDPMRQSDTHRSHIGITNVRSRLEALCNGTLTIDSVKNVGTTVTIFLPEGGFTHEDPADR